MAEPDEAVTVLDGPVPGLQFDRIAHQEVESLDGERREAAMRAAKWSASRCNRTVAAARAAAGAA